MKTTHYFIMAIVTATVLMQSVLAAGLPAPLPEFKSQEELRRQYAAHETQQSGEPHSEGAEVFYTGKTIDSDTGTFLFKYRNYDPELSRWIVADPSGFPDGANNRAYAPIPTCEFDFQGLQAHRTFSGITQSITLTVGVYDPTNTVTQSTLFSWDDAVELAWAYAGTDQSNQNSLLMNTNISFSIITGTYDQTAALLQYDNVVTFEAAGFRSRVTGDRVGLFAIDISTNTLIHEVGHFMEAPDKYTNTANGSVPNSGWENTIMGQANQSTATKLDANLVLTSLGEQTHLFE
jgi:RHS repeat-associated protein